MQVYIRKSENRIRSYIRVYVVYTIVLRYDRACAYVYMHAKGG